MATKALRTPNSLPRRPLYLPVNRTIDRHYLTGMAILLAWWSSWLYADLLRRRMLRAPLPSPILHFHGAASPSGCFLPVQSALISARRVSPGIARRQSSHSVCRPS
jgi:hypothetical protein